MNKKDKLLKRFYGLPKDFFVNDNDENSYIMHKPHPSNIIKGYVMRQVLTFLKANGYLNK